MVTTAFVIGLALMTGWAVVCFWLAVRYQRRQRARGARVDKLTIRTFIVAGAGCAIMFFVVIFLTLNPPPASLETMRP